MDFDNYKPGNDPLKDFQSWFNYAVSKGEPEPNAMSLATSVDGKPHLRIVLFKGISDDSFCFYTNYESNKANEIFQNSNVALCFHWKTLNLQVRVEGQAFKMSHEESGKYFSSRPRASQISAWASKQSREIKDRDQLLEQFKAVEVKFSNEKVIPCPPFWGGFRLIPQTIELWIGRKDRLHDRFLFIRQKNSWEASRLSP